MIGASHLLAFLIGFLGGVAMAAGLRRSGMDRDEIARFVLGLLILALVAYSTAMTYRSSERLAGVAECQREQNQRFSEAIAARGEATTRGNAAQRDFLATVADPALGPAETQEAFRRYLAALDEIDASRAANPLIVIECS